MSNEMIERVAKAISEAANNASVAGFGEWCSDEMALAAARAAIEAMREPTKEMCRAFYLLDEAGAPTPCVKGWQAMIDVALGQKDAANVR